MIRRKLARLTQMNGAEIYWRSRAQAGIAFDRLRSAVVRPRWDRETLLSALAPLPELAGVRDALTRRRWDEANRGLAEHFTSSPQRFVISASNRLPLTNAIRHEFPDSVQTAAARANRIVRGEYDLLGYRGLQCAHAAAPAPDWHTDPVHGRTAPRHFWSTVPYLDPSCGDHKIIWELNRHQHWLALGRAFWLTGDSKYRERCLAELASWRDDNPPCIGINWASMLELGLRSISWMWALNFFADATTSDESPWIVDLLVMIDRQLGQVERNLSYYFSPNTHLLGEALALYVVGRSLPELLGSERRAAIGRRVLVSQIARQVAADGGHCERSTHYHRYTLDFYNLALAVARITGDDDAAGHFELAVARLASAARSLCDDLGRLPLIGDDDGGQLTPILGRSPEDIRDSLAIAAALVNRRELSVGPPPEEALWLLAHPALTLRLDALRTAPPAPAPGSIALPDTGYYISRSASNEHIVIDGGPHGYLNAGHAHADALSLTMSVRGVPMLIDPGTGSYTVDCDLRDRMRSTALHNTLVLDGRSQSASRGPFRWADTADGRVLRWRTNHAFDYFEGAHDGYRPAEHRRHVLVLHGDLMIVADLVRGPGPHHAAVHWHVDPKWTVRVSGQRVELMSDGQRCDLVVPSGVVDRFAGDVETGLGWHAPVYGRMEPATTIRVSAGSAAPFWVVSVFGLDARNRVKSADFLTVEAPAGAPGDAVGIQINRETSVDNVAIAEAADGTCGTTWRAGVIETDAHLVFWRAVHGRDMLKVALVDGSLARVFDSGLQVALASPVPHLHRDNVCAA
jgi:hypothetical protein